MINYLRRMTTTIPLSEELAEFAHKNMLTLLIKYIPVVAIVINVGICFEFFIFNTTKLYEIAGYVNGYGFTVLLLLFIGSVKYRLCLWHKILLLDMLFNLIAESINECTLIKTLAYSISLTILILIAIWATHKKTAKSQRI